MPKINREEYEVLNRLIAPLRKFKQYIARDEDGMLNAYRIKPRKYSNGCWVDGYLKVGVQKDLFQFIQWEDEEPHNIQELIEKYEGSKKQPLMIFDEFIMDESEETEVKKDLKWLKDEILTDMRYLEGNRDIRHLDIKYQTLREVAQKITSLDEPETLSPEWIDENITQDDIKGNGYVAADALYGLLVPKQEEITEEQAWGVIHGKYGNETLQNNIDYVESQGYVVIEKPTIPQFVADYIKHEKNIRRPLFTSLDGLHKNPNTEKEVSDWYNANTAEYLRAWLDGYTVEKEPRYRLKLNGDYLSRVQIDYEAEKGKPMEVTILADVNGFSYNFSEDEKSYVEKYLNVEVEELEE